MEPEAKTLTLQLKSDGNEGDFAATFATLNVVDHHGDVTVPGAFTDGKAVLIGGYQHDMMSLPVGKGVIRADETRAWVDGSFFLDTAPGKDTHATVKAAGDLMEWSYIFNVQAADYGQFDTGKGVVDVRFLKQLDVWSVDPVLKGAGIGTGTDSIKGFTRGLTFIDHAAGVSGQVDAFLARVKERLAVRSKEGRQLSTANMEKLAGLAESLHASAACLEQMCADASPPKAIDLQHEFLTFQRNLSLASGLLATA